MAYKIVDMTHVNWQQTNNYAGTLGCYFKTHFKENGYTYYYKLSAYDVSRGFYGMESINEVIASRLLKKLGICCADYKLVKMRVSINGEQYITFGCKSKSYRKDNESAIAFDDFYMLNRIDSKESILDFCKRIRIQKIIKTIFIADYIIMNRDRHGANIEVLNSNGKIRIAPLFDNGLSFVCSMTPDIPNVKKQIKSFDPLTDMPVNNFIGYRSLFSNLGYIDNPIKVHKLTKADRRAIFYNLSETVDKVYLDKIWQIIVYRYSLLRKRGLIVEV